MGIAERKQQQKESTRASILDAALIIVRQEGWSGLSMRKIADLIGYSAPTIYEYFKGKDTLLTEFTRLGFLKLARAMKYAAKKHLEPKVKLINMWLAYWNFAFAEKEFYQVMFSVGINYNNDPVNRWGDAKISSIVTPIIAELMKDPAASDFNLSCKYCAYWSAIHGLITLNFQNYKRSDDFNMQVLLDLIHGITVVEWQ